MTHAQFTPHQCEHGLVLALLSGDSLNLAKRYQDDALAQMNDAEFSSMMERVAIRVYKGEI